MTTCSKICGLYVKRRFFMSNFEENFGVSDLVDILKKDLSRIDCSIDENSSVADIGQCCNVLFGWRTDIEKLNKYSEYIYASVASPDHDPGDGNQYWQIYSISKGNSVIYFKISYVYSSWAENYYDNDCFSIVTPKQKTVTYFD